MLMKKELGLIVLGAALLGPAHGFAQTGTTSGQKPQQTSGQKPQPQPPPTTSQPPTKPTGTGSGTGTTGAGTGTTTPAGTFKPAAAGVAQPAARPPQAVTAPADYIIGPDDILTIAYWREKDLSADVVVRPDGKVSLPLVNDIQAAGLTPDQLRDAVQKAAGKYVTDPSVTIVVKQINSRKVFVTGSVNKPGPIPMNEAMTVLQVLAMAGGLTEFANEKEILILRTERGQQQTFKFNYKDVRRGKSLQQNIVLKPGDTIVVP